MWVGRLTGSCPYLTNWQVDDHVTMFVPAFGVPDGIVECEVAYLDAEQDYTHLRYCMSLTQFSPYVDFLNRLIGGWPISDSSVILSSC